MTTKRIIFEGRIQKVGFRYAIRQIALGFEVTGWIKILSHETAELVIEGEVLEVEEFIEEITVESTLSHHIKSYTQEDIATLKNVRGFTISKNS